MYPGAVAEFFFDQSTAHGAYAKDALNANKMNVNPKVDRYWDDYS